MARLLTKAEMIGNPFHAIPRLKAISEAVLLLRENFESRAIETTSAPAQVRNSKVLFQKYPMDTFKTFYSNHKKEY